MDGAGGPRASDDTASTRPGRRRRVLAMAVAGMVVLASAGAWVAASQARTPAQRASQAQPPPTSTVTAPVTAGRLVDEVVLEGVLTRAEVTTVTGPGSVAGAERLVVTALPVGVGDEVSSGTVLVEVSGRPVIALAGEFPAYRDLEWQMNGPDVRQLQRALQPVFGTPVTGVYDDRTERDVRRLYASVGYEPVERPVAAAPSTPATTAPPPAGEDAAETRPEPPAAPATSPPPLKAVVPLGEIAYLPRLPATVTALAVAVGDDASDALLDVAGGDWRVTAPLSPDTAADLAALTGNERISFRGGPLDGQETTLEEVVEAPAGGQEATEARPTAVFAVPEGAGTLRAGEGQTVVVERARSPQDAVVVPLSALWTTPDGTVVVTVVTGTATRDVPVEVTVTVAGEAAVRPLEGARLAVGDEVLVGYRDAGDG